MYHLNDKHLFQKCFVLNPVTCKKISKYNNRQIKNESYFVWFLHNKFLLQKAIEL
jgi:hypothetical protein